MTTGADLSVADRLAQVLRHVGIERTHFAASILTDITGFVQAHPERIASLTLVCPPRLDPGPLRALGARLLIIAGDQGGPGTTVRQAVASLPDATVVWLHGYYSPTWADAVAERTEEIGAALLDFLRPIDQSHRVSERAHPQGVMAGITYHIQGEGPPLVLMPLGLAPSQWDPLGTWLGVRYQTVTLGGPALGMPAMLESRGHEVGYLGVVERVMEAIHLRPGEVILDAGCGSGVLDRWLARSTGQANRIIGVDRNPYLLREAAALAMREGLAGIIAFQEGDAEALPFPDNHVDVAVSYTVLNEGDADRMLAEMVRATKPGGRVAVVVAAKDIPWVVNVPLRPELKAKAQVPGTPLGPRGCADASLYRRFYQAGLTHVQMFPQFAPVDQPHTPRGQFTQAGILGALTAEETKEWHAGMAQAVAEGTYFIAQAYHCAVGTKPEIVG
jgi:ubiquinone/menaquinone biosynthesis C-methylase UbiE